MKNIVWSYLCGNCAKFHGNNITEWSHEVPYSLCIIFNIHQNTLLKLKDTFNHTGEVFHHIIPIQKPLKLKYSRARVFIWNLYDEDRTCQCKCNVLSVGTSTTTLNSSQCSKFTSYIVRDKVRKVERESRLANLTRVSTRILRHGKTSRRRIEKNWSHQFQNH